MKVMLIGIVMGMFAVSGCSMLQDYVMKAAMDNADRIAKLGDLYCEETDAAQRLELRAEITKLREGKNMIIEC